MVTVYSTGCINCKHLIEKLDNAQIPYEINRDLSEILKIGFTTVPILKINDEFLTYKEAVKYINKIGGGAA